MTFIIKNEMFYVLESLKKYHHHPIFRYRLLIQLFLLVFRVKFI